MEVVEVQSTVPKTQSYTFDEARAKGGLFSWNQHPEKFVYFSGCMSLYIDNELDVNSVQTLVVTAWGKKGEMFTRVVNKSIVITLLNKE